MTAQTVLHVAALPFPSHQGTQGLLRRMLEASHEAGRDAQLLTYAAAGYPLTPRFPLHRVPDFPRVRSLRSGPSLGKVLLDAHMAWHCARLHRRLRPRVVVAHSVEAGLLCLPLQPLVFFAHTDMGEELPCYGPAAAAPALRRLGRSLDGACLRAGRAVAAVSPRLARRMQSRVPADVPVRYVPPPWPVAPEPPAAERSEARHALGLHESAPLLLYAGNLDGYQHWQRLIEVTAALSPQHPELRLLVATQSDTTALRRCAAETGVGQRVLVAELNSEAARRRAHAAADVALVPRGAEGGLPIKLLDALSRGVPTVASSLASADLQLAAAARVVAAEDPQAMAVATHELLRAPATRQAMAQEARRYIAREHSDARFLESFDAVIAQTLG